MSNEPQVEIWKDGWLYWTVKLRMPGYSLTHHRWSSRAAERLARRLLRREHVRNVTRRWYP